MTMGELSGRMLGAALMLWAAAYALNRAWQLLRAALPGLALVVVLAAIAVVVRHRQRLW